MNINNKYIFFRRHLLNWHNKANKRIMPWTREKNIYKIWISEIILQQTRAEQGRSYYLDFINRFPTLQVLAEANQETVFKLWEGLGYYTRVKNLHFTAQNIYYNYNGEFPKTYNDLLQLKGIGPYTAAALASFAYNLPHAVVDGNVFRVLSRFFGVTLPIDSSKGKKHFALLANELLDKKCPATYNQAIMDFGATVCVPRIPLCHNCTLQPKCEGFRLGLVNMLPIKEKILIKTKRFFTYFIFLYENKILVNKRIEKDIWENLYEFYLFESASLTKWKSKEIELWLVEQMGINEYQLIHISEIQSQQLTHQKIEGQFIVINISNFPASLKHFTQIDLNQIKEMTFPKFINHFLKQEFVNINLKLTA